MSAEIQLRPGVLFRTDAAHGGVIELAAGRRFEGVYFYGTVAGTSDSETLAQVQVLGAVYPASPNQIAMRERLPALAVVPVATEYLRSDRDILFSLFALPSAVEVEGALDPTRTVVLPMHGDVDVSEAGHLQGGRPCLPSDRDDRWISLEPIAVATLVEWVRGPDGQRPNALVNMGCFSSTPRDGKGPTFNEELAVLLAHNGEIAVYGPPHAGVVTAASLYGQWRNQFLQQLHVNGIVSDVAVRFKRIVPAAALPNRLHRRQDASRRSRKPTLYGTVVITNDCSLAAELAAFSPDFSEQRPHGFDRSLME